MTSGLFRLSDINECTISVDNCDANALISVITPGAPNEDIVQNHLT